MGYISDSFSRVDNAASMGSADTGQVWSAMTGTWGVLTGAAYTASHVDNDSCSIDVGANQMVVQCEMLSPNHAANGEAAGLLASVTDSSNYYLVQIVAFTNTFEVWKKVAAIYTQLHSSAWTGMDYGIVRVDVAAQVKAYLNGVLRATVAVDAALTGTKAGFRWGSAGTTVTTAQWNNFWATSASGRTTNPAGRRVVVGEGMSRSEWAF